MLVEGRVTHWGGMIWTWIVLPGLLAVCKSVFLLFPEREPQNVWIIVAAGFLHLTGIDHLIH